MYQTDQATATNTLPTPASAGTQGFFTNGNPASGVPATIVDADWLNMIQQELVNVVEAGGETLSKTTYNQVLQAILALTGNPANNKVSGVVGQTRNLAMSVATASSTATLTADEIIVESALGGLRYCLPSFSKTINLATTGAGGMDTGSAPASGFVAIYAIYNPTTGTENLLATNATAAKVPEVYGGANLPSGYTASALVSVWQTNSSGQFIVGEQIDREISTFGTSVLSTSAASPSYTALNIAAAVPKNAVYYEGTVVLTSSSSQASLYFAMTSAGLGNKEAVSVSSNISDSVGINVSGRIRTPQTIYYSLAISGGTLTASLNISMYRF